MALEGLAEEVTVDLVLSLMEGRPPEILTDEDESTVERFETAVRGTTVEVVPLVGTNPADGPRRDLAVQCIAYGVAARIESGLFPEQQGPGDSGLARYLRAMYNELRSQLKDMPADDPPAAGANPSVGPVGSFPPALPYPDPARCW